MKPSGNATSRWMSLAFWATAAVVVLAWDGLWGRFLPNASGLVGHDYSYFLPQLLAGFFAYQGHEAFSIPWFTPAFCGGGPLFANPQSTIASVPQLLAIVLSPVASIRMTGLLFAFAGFAGTHRLLRDAFRTSQPAALLGGVVFALNGFFGARMAVGHLTMHAFMLAPLMAWLLLRPRSTGDRKGLALDGVLTGLAVAYTVWSGAVVILLPLAFSVLAVGLLHGTLLGGRKHFWLRAGIATGVAALLSSAKLAAIFAYVGNFPRDQYKLPGIEALSTLASTTLRVLFLSPDDDIGRRVLVNRQWLQGRHEFEFGLGLVPLVLLTLGLLSVVVDRVRGRRTSRLHLPEAIGLVLVLAMPLVLNWYAPSWNAFLKSVPVVRSSSTMLRWFLVFLPVVTVGSVLVFDRIRGVRRFWILAAAGVVLVLAQHGLTNTDAYMVRAFDPGRVEKAWTEARRTGAPPPVQSVVSARADALATGASSRTCYEALYGYRLELFPVGTLRTGSPFAVTGSHLNLKNPACYVFPKENGCAPGDHFRVDQMEQAKAFARYESFDFKRSGRQVAANAINGFSFLGVLAFLVFAAWTRTGGRRAHRESKCL